MTLHAMALGHFAPCRGSSAKRAESSGLMLCYGFEPFQTYWTRRQKRTAKRYVNVINFYYRTFNQCDQVTMRSMIDANDRLPNV